MSLKHSIFYPVLEPETELLSPHLLSTLLFWLRDWYSPPPTFLHHHSYHPWVVSPVSGGLRLLPRIHSCFPFCLFSIEWSQFCELQICSASPPQNLSAFSVLFSSPLFVWPSLNNSAPTISASVSPSSYGAFPAAEECAFCHSSLERNHYSGNPSLIGFISPDSLSTSCKMVTVHTHCSTYLLHTVRFLSGRRAVKSGPLAGPVVPELAEYLCTASCTKIHKTGESGILMSYTHWNGMTL